MRRFSHWEYVDRRTFWGWRREWYPVYVEDLNVIHVVIGCEVGPRQDPELMRITRETERMRAIKQQLDAEADMLDSYLKVARKQAELQGLLQLTDQTQVAHEPKLLPYRPQIPVAKVR